MKKRRKQDLKPKVKTLIPVSTIISSTQGQQEQGQGVKGVIPTKIPKVKKIPSTLTKEVGMKKSPYKNNTNQFIPLSSPHGVNGLKTSIGGSLKKAVAKVTAAKGLIGSIAKGKKPRGRPRSTLNSTNSISKIKKKVLGTAGVKKGRGRPIKSPKVSKWPLVTLSSSSPSDEIEERKRSKSEIEEEEIEVIRQYPVSYPTNLMSKGQRSY